MESPTDVTMTGTASTTLTFHFTGIIDSFLGPFRSAWEGRVILIARFVLD